MTVSPFQRKIPDSISNDRSLLVFVKSFINTLYELFVFANEFSGSQTQSITASGGVTYNKRVTRIVGSSGAITVTATPSVKAIEDGKEIIIQGTSDTNTVLLQDESNLANSGLSLSGNTDMTLGKGDTLHLIYSQEDSKYYEISRSNN